jgi:predicted nucleic acid-binding Zn ribbon protein
MDESAQPARRAVCAECGLDLSTVASATVEPASPCPHCGSRRRNGFAFAGVATGTGAAVSPEAVAKEPDPDYHGGSLRKPARERRVGMSLTADDGIERSRRRDYDRMGDWYEETILNPDGSIRHHEAHPLHDHRDHGSAKPKSST